MSDLDGRVVLITGARGGLGTAVTQAFLNAGARVIGSSRSIQDADFPHPSFTAMPAELTSGEAAESLVSRVVERFGRIDALVHLLGGFAGGKFVAETDDATLDKMLSLNFRSAFLIMRPVVRRMHDSAGGRLIAIGSRAVVEPVPNVAVYSASKAALVALMRSLAVENREFGITANAILPGTIDTPANRTAMPDADFSKWVDPKQIAALAVWLVSENGGQVSGAAIPVYGRDV